MELKYMFSLSSDNMELGAVPKEKSKFSVVNLNNLDT